MPDISARASKFLSRPELIFGVISTISIVALAAAFGSEAFLGLEPCVLCIYQRYPYAIVMMLSAIGYGMRNRVKAAVSLLSLCSVTFAVNSAIAFYHTGVERKWWESHSESCTIFHFENKGQSVLENIMSTPMGRCDEIPWQDPFIGLSMANYNVALCLLLAVICAAAAITIARKPISAA